MTVITSEEHLITSHELELLHLVFGELNDGVVVVLAVVNDELVGGLLVL